MNIYCPIFEQFIEYWW